MNKKRDRLTVDLCEGTAKRIAALQRRYKALGLVPPKDGDLARDGVEMTLDKQEAILSALEAARRETAKRVRS